MPTGVSSLTDGPWHDEQFDFAGLASVSVRVSSLSTGLSTQNSTVATLSTPLGSHTTRVESAVAQGVAFTGTLIGAAGSGGTDQTCSHSGAAGLQRQHGGLCVGVKRRCDRYEPACSTASADGATAYGSNAAATAENMAAVGVRELATYAG